MRQKLPQSEGETRTTRNQEIKNSHCDVAVESKTKAYLNSVQPARKRESEARSFKELQKGYSVGEIEVALEHVQKYGLPSSGVPCHSPMAFLSKAMKAVLDETLRSAHDASARSQREDDLARQRRGKEEADRREEELVQRRTLAFEEAFPSNSAQSQLISTYARTLPMLNLNGPIVRNLAIGAWWSQKGSTTTLT